MPPRLLLIREKSWGDGVQNHELNQSLSDQEFVQKVYHDYQRLIYFVVRKYTSSPIECEDIVQDCLEKLIVKVGLLRRLHPAALANYIVVASRNTAISFLKWKSHETAAVISLDDIREEATLDRESPLEREILHQEDLKEFLDAWELMDKETKMVLEGKYILGYDDKMLAELLGCQPGSVRMKLTRARRKVKAKMKGSDGHDRS